MSTVDPFASGDAQILDRGYRHYDGARTGVRGAMWAVVRHSVQRALGVRRTIWAKVLPIASVAIAYMPAIVFVGIVALIKANDRRHFLLPSYGDYYAYVIAAIMVFTGFVAPEVLCTDRRTGMLGVYLASPLDRRTYLAAKAASIAFAISLVCLGPTMLMLIANVLQSQGPTGVGDVALTFVRVIGAGVAVTLLYTSITMGIASLTDRKMIATAGVLLLFLVSLMVVGTLHAVGLSVGSRAVAPTLLSLDIATRVHGERSQVFHGVSSAFVWGAWLAWTVGGFALAWFQLKRLPVTR
jgi:ABC-2 type transport system permease protein